MHEREHVTRQYKIGDLQLYSDISVYHVACCASKPPNVRRVTDGGRSELQTQSSVSWVTSKWLEHDLSDVCSDPPFRTPPSGGGGQRRRERAVVPDRSRVRIIISTIIRIIMISFISIITIRIHSNSFIITWIVSWCYYPPGAHAEEACYYYHCCYHYYYSYYY